MKPGEEFECEFCGAQSFIIKKSKMDGWTKISDLYNCASCGRTIEEVFISKEQNTESIENDKPDKLGYFAAILGEKQIEKKTIEADDKKFCRDCKHYIKHPFFNKCGLKNEEVNPMDDCSEYLEKEKE